MSLYQVICISFLQEVSIWYNQKKPKIPLRMENHRIEYSLRFFGGIKGKVKNKRQSELSQVLKDGSICLPQGRYLETRTYQNQRHLRTLLRTQFLAMNIHILVEILACLDAETLTISPSEKQFILQSQFDYNFPHQIGLYVWAINKLLKLSTRF